MLASGRIEGAVRFGTAGGSQVRPSVGYVRDSTRRQVIKHTLFDLKTGDTAKILGIGTDTPLSLRRRLLDMGITKGAELRVERHAPLGDPVEIFVKGYFLALRMSEARTIEVEQIKSSSESLLAASESSLD